MDTKVEEISINGVAYVPKCSVVQKAEQIDGMDYCIVRTYSAGVFAGYVKSRNGRECEIVKVRRIWYWDGAASLSQLAVDGVSKPQNCKFAVEVDKITVTEAIEILPCTEKARKNIQEVKEWKQ
ncbi:MAG: hypothetical protein ABSE82_08250 [Nitrososphaerales archaeon]|jgi:hypothetical protein